MSTIEHDISPRLKEFVAEVDDLKVTGGRSNPERTWMIIGAVGIVLGLVLTLMAWIRTGGTSNTGDFADFAAMGRFGLALTVAGAVLFAVMGTRRWLRFWLVRLVYEMREQSDRFDRASMAPVEHELSRPPTGVPNSSPR